MNKIAAIGEILWDNFPDGKILGGAPTNFAIFAKYLGNDSYIISAIGNDELGSEMIEKLRSWDINIDLLQIREEYATGEVNVSVDQNGIPHYQIVENRACDHIHYSDELDSYLDSFDAISYGSLSSRSEETKQTIFKFLNKLSDQCLKACDLNIRKNYFSLDLIRSLLEISTIFKINNLEKTLLEKVLSVNLQNEKDYKRFIKKYHLDVLIITNGEIESEIITSDIYSRKKSKQVKVKDTVGAGDSFLAAFIDAYLKGLPIEKIHEQAIELSAKVCQVKGATGLLYI